MVDDLKLFLASGRVRISHYGGGEEDYEILRLVRARDHDDAKKKFDSYYESKTVKYTVTYTIIESDASDIIE